MTSQQQITYINETIDAFLLIAHTNTAAYKQFNYWLLNTEANYSLDWALHTTESLQQVYDDCLSLRTNWDI